MSQNWQAEQPQRRYSFVASLRLAQTHSTPFYRTATSNISHTLRVEGLVGTPRFIAEFEATIGLSISIMRREDHEEQANIGLALRT
jgi:hypothetical protein